MLLSAALCSTRIMQPVKTEIQPTRTRIEFGEESTAEELSKWRCRNREKSWAKTRRNVAKKKQKKMEKLLLHHLISQNPDEREEWSAHKVQVELVAAINGTTAKAAAGPSCDWRGYWGRRCARGVSEWPARLLGRWRQRPRPRRWTRKRRSVWVVLLRENISSPFRLFHFAAGPSQMSRVDLSMEPLQLTRLGWWNLSHFFDPIPDLSENLFSFVPFS